MLVPDTILRDLVLIGGGHAHIHVLKMLGMKPIRGVQLTLITRDMNTPYSGMLPGHIAGLYTKAQCHLDLCRMARFSGARLVHTEAVGIDIGRRLVHCRDGRPPIQYDALSIDIGATPKFISGQNPQELNHVTRVKPIDDFSRKWDGIVQRVLQMAERGTGASGGADSATTASGKIRLVVVGGGAGGIELTLAMQHKLQELLTASGRDVSLLQLVLVSKSEAVLSTHNIRTQGIFARILRERDIELHLGKNVVGLKEHANGEVGGALTCGDGSEVAFDEVIWCTNSGAADWLRQTGLQLDDEGFICVDKYLQSSNTPGVFAAGDCCHMVESPRPKAGVFAVRAGPPLEANLRSFLEGKPLEPFHPQATFLGLISTGNRYAVASKGPVAMEGAWLWNMKDRIDRQWMAMYQELPEMEEPKPELSDVAVAAGPAAALTVAASSMRCRGCGSKVGSSLLHRVLSKLGLGGDVVGDDAAIVPAPPPGHSMVHTVDFFRAFITDPFVFGAIAANHALSDVHAMGGSAKTALAIAVVPYADEGKMEATLLQLLGGALQVLEDAGCKLVGGHTCEGTELALGFAVNGTVDEKHILRKGGLKAGHVLILTKALGTGAIFSADMRGKAHGEWVEGAIKMMKQSNRLAAEVAKRCGAVAVTDVTGFGLLGHLMEMVEATSAAGTAGAAEPPAVHVTLDLDALPVLDGALDCMQMGIRSSLHPSNKQVADDGRLTLSAHTSEHAKWDMLFDPQTAGGLLCCVPHPEAEACIDALKKEGYTRAVILGKISESTTNTVSFSC